MVWEVRKILRLSREGGAVGLPDIGHVKIGRRTGHGDRFLVARLKRSPRESNVGCSLLLPLSSHHIKTEISPGVIINSLPQYNDPDGAQTSPAIAPVADSSRYILPPTHGFRISSP